jgi:hypothetical protein
MLIGYTPLRIQDVIRRQGLMPLSVVVEKKKEEKSTYFW